MGNCCGSPATVKSRRSETKFPKCLKPVPAHDHGKKDEPARAGSMKRQITVLNGTSTIRLADKYKLHMESHLGKGQFGITFKCVDRVSEELLACKMILKTTLTKNAYVDDLRREVEIMKLLRGKPNIITIKEAYEDEYAVHLVMELCEGGQLFHRIRARHHYEERAAAGLMKTIMDAVQVCHSHGVMHRDLKPDNFLFLNTNENSPLKAIDFGVSVFFKPGERFSEFVGGAYYMAPEVIKRDYGPEIDIWSAGVILYVLLCGQLPFRGRTHYVLERAILEGVLEFERDPWPNVSESAKSLVRQMLERDPKLRLTAKQVLEHPWIQDV